MAAADAFALEAEGLVQAARPPVRAEDRELGLPETASAHPLEGPPHQDAPEADLPPPIADRDPDGSHVTGLREPPAVTVRRADRLSVRVGDEEDRSHAVERSEPLSLLVEVRTDRSEEHTSELQSRLHLVCRLLLEKKKK